MRCFFNVCCFFFFSELMLVDINPLCLWVFGLFFGIGVPNTVALCILSCMAITCWPYVFAGGSSESFQCLYATKAEPYECPLLLNFLKTECWVKWGGKRDRKSQSSRHAGLLLLRVNWNKDGEDEERQPAADGCTQQKRWVSKRRGCLWSKGLLAALYLLLWHRHPLRPEPKSRWQHLLHFY